MFSCEFYDISKNTFFIEHTQETASAHQSNKVKEPLQKYGVIQCYDKLIWSYCYLYFKCLRVKSVENVVT